MPQLGKPKRRAGSPLRAAGRSWAVKWLASVLLVLILTLCHGCVSKSKARAEAQAAFAAGQQQALANLARGQTQGPQVTLIGEVRNPGAYAFTKKDITIVEAISMAGGFTRIAARNKTRIVRVENNAEKIYDVNVDAITKAGKMIQAVPVKSNDLIVVPESFF